MIESGEARGDMEGRRDQTETTQRQTAVQGNGLKLLLRTQYYSYSNAGLG